MSGAVRRKRAPAQAEVAQHDGPHRRAVVLFNLGGPDSPNAVRPFLFNLFNDGAIIRLPQPLRRLVASLIARRRAPLAQAIYARIGGRSPLLAQTEAQAAALEAALDDGTRVFVAMRYWHPLTEATAASVRRFEPDEVILLPLYPQFSTTTTASSLAAWRRAADLPAEVPVRAICCYPTEAFLATAHARRLTEFLDGMPEGPLRVLFSAHGLPERIVAGGDPYAWQVEQTVAAVVAAIDRPDLDWVLSYQSRVGPLRWIGPSTDDEIRRAGADAKALVVVPIAFVSEHSETLVELDIEYAHLAASCGVPHYRRVPTLSADAGFIAGLADLVRATTRSGRAGIRPAAETRLCPPGLRQCPCKTEIAA